MQCTSCGVDLPADARVCPACGTVFAAARAGGAGVRPRSGLVIGVVALGILVALVVWLATC